jgi:hypothetical protein
MNELYRHRAFADSRGDSFDRTVADVADGENAGNIRLQQERITIE